ncbi:MAG TPA: hypothetical protein VNO82_22480 [Solirubrobacteraceae bacterium]|nr:hypothetical protein [Solirubrobacteraceae bacterium]
MRSRLLREEGDVLVIAVVMVTLMLVLGAAAMSTVDTQSDVVKRDRQHESTFNLVEGVLNAQTFVLGRLGTGNVTSQFPEQCSSALAVTLCPSPEQVGRTYAGAVQNDYDPAVTWWTQVRDNPNGTLYSPTAVSAAERYDANDDSRLWVTASATVRDRTRTLVALIAVENRAITFPSYALLGAYLESSNNGNSTLINAGDSLGIAVRCSEAPESACLDYSTKQGGQLTPANAYQLDYGDDLAIQPDALADLEDFAKASGTYYATCPAAPPNGAVVVIESGNCPAWTGSAASCCNSATEPGLLIIKCGSVEFGGTVNFHGIVYAPNRTTTEATGSWCVEDDIVVTTQGNAGITGGVLVDGPGGIKIGSSGKNGKVGNLVYSPAAFSNVKVAGTAGVVQNTWREIPDDN